MSDKEDLPADESADLRGQMIKRLVVAGVLVAVLLGLLAFFDHLSKTPDEPALPVYTEPVPVGPRKMITQPVTPAEPSTETVPAPAPVVENAAPAETPPPPVVENPPAEPSTVTPPASPQPRQTPAPKKAAPTLSPPPPPAPPAVPEASASPPIAPVVRETPPAQQAPARVVQRSTVNPAPRLFSGFVLQAGVFASADRAEELHAKLALSGLPSSVETRVQVGPFKSRQEAERAQEKLRELGIYTILVPPKGKP